MLKRHAKRIQFLSCMKIPIRMRRAHTHAQYNRKREATMIKYLKM